MKTVKIFETKNGLTHIDPDLGVDYAKRTIGSGYAIPLGEFASDVEVTEGVDGGRSEGLFVGNVLFKPVKLSNGSIALAPPPHSRGRVNWVQLKKVK